VSDPRQPHETGFALRDPFAWADLRALVREGEALGFAAVFLPEIDGRDTFVALGEIAGETSTLLLANGIAPMTSRPVVLTAMAAAAVQERSTGRHIVGLGTGPARPGALDRLREQVASLRRLLAGDEVDGRRLSLRLDDPPPIWIAALGPNAVSLGAEIADGVVLNWCTPERVAAARTQMDEVATRAGRDPGSIAIAVYVRGNLGADRLPLEIMASQYARYPAYARQFEAMGLEKAARAAADGASGQLVASVCLPADPSAARERLLAYAAAGADLPVVYPVIDGPEALPDAFTTLRGLAPESPGTGGRLPIASAVQTRGEDRR